MTQIHSIRRALLSWVQQHTIFTIPLNMELANVCHSSQREFDLVRITHSMEIVHEMLRLHRTTMPPIFYLPKLTRRLARNAFIDEEEAGWAVNSWAMALGLIPFSEKTLASIVEVKHQKIN